MKANLIFSQFKYIRYHILHQKKKEDGQGS